MFKCNYKSVTVCLISLTRGVRGLVGGGDGDQVDPAICITVTQGLLVGKAVCMLTNTGNFNYARFMSLAN